VPWTDVENWWIYKQGEKDGKIERANRILKDEPRKDGKGKVTFEAYVIHKLNQIIRLMNE
jgi:hypothetical protein